MFSGLTNQVTSWVGGKKGEQEDGSQPPAAEAPPVPEAVPQAPEPTEPVADDSQSPTKAGGGMFSNVKSQMTGWLGNASIPSMPTVSMPSMPTIPGFSKKNAEEEGAAAEVAGDVAKEAEVPAVEATEAAAVDDEDKSRYISATEGADSKPGSGPTTPQDDQAGQIGQVTTKVTQGVKSFGSFLYSSVNKAGAKIKETVKDNQSILGEFTKEQEAFMKENAGKGGSGQPPWVGVNNSEKVKEEILGLSADRRNFVRAPPAGVDFLFDYDVSYTVAQAIMAEDPALEKMRFDLVPKIITEENFWRNYFYRVSLICQAAELGTLGTDSAGGQASTEE